MNASRLWVLGGVLLSALLLAGGYFLAVAPQLDALAEAASKQAAVESQNASLESALTQLKKDSEGLDAAKTQLAALRLSVPTDAAMSSFMDQINQLAASTGVSVDSVTVADPQPYAGPVEQGAAPVADTTAEGAADVSTDAAAGSTPPVGLPEQSSALITPENFVAIPVSFSITGDRARVLDFLSALQHAQRLFLVDGFSMTASTQQAEEADGEGAVSQVSTPMNGAIKGYVYALLDQTAAAASATPAPAATAAQ